MSIERKKTLCFSFKCIYFYIKCKAQKKKKEFLCTAGANNIRIVDCGLRAEFYLLFQISKISLNGLMMASTGLNLNFYKVMKKDT